MRSGRPPGPTAFPSVSEGVMPWARVDDNFPDHPKTQRLKEILNNPDADAYPVRLWCWGLKYAPGGELTMHSPTIIAAALRWTGEPQVILDALLEAGFIVKIRRRLVINDWLEYSGQWEIKTQQGNNRMRRFREKRRKQGKVLRVTGALRNALKVTHPEGDRIEGDRREEDQDQNNPPNPPHKPRGARDEGFQDFWQAYPRKVGKAAALKAWRSHVNGNAVAVLEAVQAQKAWPLGEGLNKRMDSDGKGGNPHPSTWLNQHRWEDETAKRAEWRPPEER